MDSSNTELEKSGFNLTRNNVYESFREYSVSSQWEKLRDFNAFSVTRQRFSRLLNPDWSIHILGASAVCKASGTPKLG